MREDGETWKKEFWRSPGYFYKLLLAVSALVALVVTTVVATLLCFFYIFGSVILWSCGFCRLFGLLYKRREGQPKKMIPEAMAGQEGGKLWERAWDLANKGNHGIRRGCHHPNFHVVPFLKSKTGLDIHNLVRMTSIKDEKLESHKQLVQVDRELAHAAIDLKYLSQKSNTLKQSTGT